MEGKKQTDKNPLTITTQINGKDVVWITKVENGVPAWFRANEEKKEALWNLVHGLFQKARAGQEEEPAVIITTQQRRVDITYFEYGSLYLSDALEKRYGKLSELFDDLWDIIEDEKIITVRRG